MILPVEKQCPCICLEATFSWQFHIANTGHHGKRPPKHVRVDMIHAQDKRKTAVQHMYRMLRKPAPTPRGQATGPPRSPIIPSMHWLFRSNIPRRRNSYIAPDINKRNFFGMGEIIGVLTNPAETVRSLTESKRLLDDARRELQESKERVQLRPKHAFARLPGFFPRKAEMQAIERALEGEPSFTVLFGPSSVGKTALLREILSNEKFHVLHFDLRIAGFADLSSLYMSLSQQMEQYFEEIASKMEGYEEFEREAWGFKHDRLSVERRMSECTADSKQQTVKTSDIARLMELFQSSLLKYWAFEPSENLKSSTTGNNLGRTQSTSRASKKSRRQDSSDSGRTQVEDSESVKSSRWGFRSWRKKKVNGETRRERASEETHVEKGNGQMKEKPVKRMPVIFFDEAHKLPVLIQSTDTMKCLLDSMLVLTKQDRLCHVIHATSDPFYQTWLRQLNVMQHCKIITIGDCSKQETRKFYIEKILPRVPERLRGPLNFEVLYDAFGGRLAHWQDYITDFVNSNGTLDIKQSSHFLQAHSLLNLHIIHSSQAATGAPAGEGGEGGGGGSNHLPNGNPNTSAADTLHPGLGPAGFKMYPTLAFPFAPNAGGGAGDAASSFSGSSTMALGRPPEFSAMQLLKVMSRLSQPGTTHLPYFHLCRELGVRSVDGMVKGRVLDLRWTECVLPGPATGIGPGGIRDSTIARQPGPSSRVIGASGPAPQPHQTSSDGPLPLPISDPPLIDSEEVMMPVSQAELGGMGFATSRLQSAYYEDPIGEVLGPKLIPTTPIMRYAMRDVVEEYEDHHSVSEYASLSDVDEY